MHYATVAICDLMHERMMFTSLGILNHIIAQLEGSDMKPHSESSKSHTTYGSVVCHLTSLEH